MPVSSSSTEGESSSNLGAIWWIERRSSDLIGATEGAFAHRNGNRLPRRAHLHAAAQAVRGPERNAAYDAVAELLLDFEGEPLLDERIIVGCFLEDERVVDVWHLLAREFDVDHRADRLDDGAFCLRLHLCHSLS
jgi:hypothetical protein